MEIKVNTCEKWWIHAPGDFIQLFFNRLFHKKHFYSGKLMLGDIDSKDLKNQRFVFLSNPGSLPGDIKVRSMVNFIRAKGNVPLEEIKNLKIQLKGVIKKYFKDLSQEELALTVLTIMTFSGCKIYILEDFLETGEYETIKRLEETLNLIREQGGLVIYFNTKLLSNAPFYFEGAMLVKENDGRYNAKIY